jgi:glyoxylase-like metal-dependent hydrolase (beta-lactamase superfamily II)
MTNTPKTAPAAPVVIRSHGALLYLIDCRDGKLLFDAGWPRSLPDLKAGMEAAGLRLSAIRFVVMSHAHMDHAGLMQKLKRYCGARLLVHEKQRSSLAELNRFFERKPDPEYEPVRIDETDVVVGTPNRGILESLGISGELLETPGHSDDSVSLLLDGGEAFTGDLTRPDMATEEQRGAVRASWQVLLDHRAAWVFPGHGAPYPASVIREMLRQAE